MSAGNRNTRRRRPYRRMRDARDLPDQHLQLREPMVNDLPEIHWILWAGTVGLEGSISARIEAATSWGYERVSLSPLDVARTEADGLSATELGRQLRDANLQVVLDPVMNWYPGGVRRSSRFAAFSADDSLRMCGELGAVALTAIGGADHEVPSAELSTRFGQLCDRAADLGAQVQLEFMPMSILPDLAIAWQIVSTANRGNGGLVFDTWHFFRGSPDFEVLSKIPGDRIFAVQLNDARADVEGTLREDTQRRLLPGDGSFDLVRAIQTLADIGALSWVGPEVMHPDLAAMAPQAAAALAGDRTRSLVAAALAARRA
jgi:sugar phosphate isomerase/epimerase